MDTPPLSVCVSETSVRLALRHGEPSEDGGRTFARLGFTVPSGPLSPIPQGPTLVPLGARGERGHAPWGPGRPPSRVVSAPPKTRLPSAPVSGPCPEPGSILPVILLTLCPRWRERSSKAPVHTHRGPRPDCSPHRPPARPPTRTQPRSRQVLESPRAASLPGAWSQSRPGVPAAPLPWGQGVCHFAESSS